MTVTFKEFHQRLLDECPRFAGDEQVRAETQQLIDALPTKLPLPPESVQVLSFEAWQDQIRDGMARMATNEEERLKVAKRLF